MANLKHFWPYTIEYEFDTPKGMTFYIHGRHEAGTYKAWSGDKLVPEIKLSEASRYIKGVVDGDGCLTVTPLRRDGTIHFCELTSLTDFFAVLDAAWQIYLDKILKAV